jgi:hypothetical protein
VACRHLPELGPDHWLWQFIEQFGVNLEEVETLSTFFSTILSKPPCSFGKKCHLSCRIKQGKGVGGYSSSFRLLKRFRF